jgi:phosphoribosylamine-glycine ligase
MKKAIVLGGTSPHITLIENLKNRGFYVILIDYLSNSPGIAVADEHIQESTLDMEAVLKIAKERKVDLVISTCIDQANCTCCYVAEKLNLPKPYDYQTALNVTNKGFMKKIMKENDIPTSAYMIVKSLEDIVWEKLEYPLVVKPVDCNSSKGVHRANNQSEVESYVKEAIKLSRTDSAIIEGFNEGYEIQVNCFATNTDTRVVMTQQKQKIMGMDGMVLQSFGSIIPAPLTKELNEQAQEIAVKIANAFALKNTPFFYQAIVTENKINVLEFAPRLGGGLSYTVIKMVTGFDVLDAAVDSFLGNDVSLDFQLQNSDKCFSTNLLYMHTGVFDHVEGMQELKAEKIIKEYYQMKKKGTIIDSDMCSSNRVAAFVVEADSYDEMYEKATKAFARIKLCDDKGNDLTNREAYMLKETR